MTNSACCKTHKIDTGMHSHSSTTYSELGTLLLHRSGSHVDASSTSALVWPPPDHRHRCRYNLQQLQRRQQDAQHTHASTQCGVAAQAQQLAAKCEDERQEGACQHQVHDDRAEGVLACNAPAHQRPFSIATRPWNINRHMCAAARGPWGNCMHAIAASEHQSHRHMMQVAACHVYRSGANAAAQREGAHWLSRHLLSSCTLGARGQGTCEYDANESAPISLSASTVDSSHEDHHAHSTCKPAKGSRHSMASSAGRCHV